MPFATPIKNAKFTNTDSQIIVHTKDNKLHLLKGDSSLTPICTIGHKGTLEGYDVSKEYNTILTWNSDGEVRAWESETCIPLSSYLLHGEDLTWVSFLKDTNSFYTLGKKQVLLWDGNTYTISGGPYKNGSTYLSADFRLPQDLVLLQTREREIQVWNIRTGRLAAPEIQFPHASEVSYRYTPQSHLLLTWDETGNIRWWKIPGSSTKSHQPSLMKRIGQIFDKSKYLKKTNTSRKDLQIKISYNSVTLITEHQPLLLLHTDIVRGAAYSNNNSTLISWTKDDIYLWDTATGELILFLHNAENNIQHAAISANYSLLTISGEKHVSNYDLGADFDFPPEHIELLVATITGTSMDRDGNITPLTHDDWKLHRKHYTEIAKRHLSTCQHREHNVLLQLKKFTHNSHHDQFN